MSEIRIDALLPQEIATRAEYIGVRKAEMPALTIGGDAVGVAALNTAVAKCSLNFVQALALGILCNVLVCLAVWMTFSARSTVDKISAIIFPIAAFVAAGFEHSVANMYFIPYALLLKMFDPEFMSRAGEKIARLENLTWENFLFNNLIPVTIGNNGDVPCDRHPADPWRDRNVNLPRGGNHLSHPALVEFVSGA